MQHWVKRARAHLVAMALQLLDHAETEYWFLASVVENVDADQT
jgi:hypothetical protein